MKEKELREHAICSKCNNKIGHTGVPLFWTLNIKRHGIKMDAVKSQDALTTFMGSSLLANVMSTNENMTECLLDEKITLCEECAMPIMELIEQTKKELEDE